MNKLAVAILGVYETLAISFDQAMPSYAELEAEEVLCGLTKKEPTFYSSYDGEIIENIYILASPFDDTAMQIRHNDVTIRNVVIHHAANARGIYSWYADNLTIENVEVRAYGVTEGPQPCPTRAPFSGYECTNIRIYGGENLSVNNIRVEGGSKGLSTKFTDDAVLNNIWAKNVRGPYPAGQCVQVGLSDRVSLTNFYCLNEENSSWPEDSISFWRSSDGYIAHGLIDGNNALTGICLMFENSAEWAVGGLAEDIEARHCQGCFSGYPSRDLEFNNVTCSDSWCDGTSRGQKANFNYWNFGENKDHEVEGYDNIVEDSYYYGCRREPYGQILWSHDYDQAVASFEATELSEQEYIPREPLSLVFDWDTCDDIPIPTTSCEDFPCQELGPELHIMNNQTLETMCQPKSSNEHHPNDSTDVCGSASWVF